MPDSILAGPKPRPAGEPSDQHLWPVATVMSTGIFATTFVQLQTLGYQPFNHILAAMNLDSNQAATFFSLSMLPWTFKVIAGLLVDSVPLWGSRRRNYLMLSAMVAVVAWLLMGQSPETWKRVGLAGDSYFYTLLGLSILLNTAIVFGSTASGGLLVEAGQRFGVSGRLSSLRAFAQNLGACFGGLCGGLLAAKMLIWVGLVAVLPLICLFFAAWFLLKEPPPLARVEHGRSFVQQFCHVTVSIGSQIENVLRRQMLLPALLLFFLQAVPNFRSASFYQYQTQTLHYSDAAIAWLNFIGYGAALLGSGVYLWWCRKVSLRTSLYLAIVLTAVSALPYLFYVAYTPYMPRALVIESLGSFLQYLAYLPLFDLAVRATPKGSEALGYSLLLSVWNIGLMIGTKAGPMLYEHMFQKNMASLIWLNAGVTLAGFLFVAVLPRTLVQDREK